MAKLCDVGLARMQARHVAVQVKLCQLHGVGVGPWEAPAPAESVPASLPLPQTRTVMSDLPNVMGTFAW